MREITRKTSKILIEKIFDVLRRTKDRRDICGMLAASNIVMAAFYDVLASSDDVLAASVGKNANER